MLSALHVTLVKVAVEICNAPEMKRKIICDIDEERNHYKQLNKILKEREEAVNSSLGLPESLQEKLMSIVSSVAMRILTWAMYHKAILELSPEFIVNFLNSSFFTQRGIIDNKRAADKLIKCDTLSITQKYKIACIYCFRENISVLFSQIQGKDRKHFYNPLSSTYFVFCSQQQLVAFWSYYEMNDVNKLIGGINIDEYMLRKAVKSGSVAAVQYCLEKPNQGYIDDALVYAAEYALICRPFPSKFDLVNYKLLKVGRKHLWVPGDYYTDILYFAFSKMREDQQITFLKRDIEGFKKEMDTFEDDRRCRTLEYFLNWPYQNLFLETARLVWDILPERNYAVLLLKICDKIESEEEYGEQESYDYIKLLKEFWCQSPECYKRYFLSNQEVTYKTHSAVNVKTCVRLLTILISLKRVSHAYRETIELILYSGTCEETENMIYSQEWLNKCIQVIREDRMIRLDELVLNRHFTETQTYRFKRELINMNLIKGILVEFVRNEKWDKVELILKWGELTDEEIILFKKELLYSPHEKK